MCSASLYVFASDIESHFSSRCNSLLLEIKQLVNYPFKNKILSLRQKEKGTFHDIFNELELLASNDIPKTCFFSWNWVRVFLALIELASFLEIEICQP